MRHLQITIIWGIIIVSCIFLSPTQARMYRWIDEDGQVHYSDNVPIEYSQRERKIFDAKGHLLSTVTGPKSQQELDEQKQLAAAEEAKRKEKIEQSKVDRGLLNSFSSVEELERFQNQRLELIGSTIVSLEDKLKRLRAVQSNLTKKSKNKPRQSDLRKIEQLNADIDFVQGQLDVQKDKKEQTEKRFVAEATRYRELKGEQTKQ